MIYTHKNTNNLLSTTKNNLKPVILIFDSGIGGISVYSEIKKQFPDIYYIYVFDNAAFPYGNKNKLFITKRIVNIIKIISKEYLISLAVIACNTASVIALIELRKHCNFPIVGTVPAIKPSVKITRNGIIGLIATYNTISSIYIQKLIMSFAKSCKILTIISNKLVHISESKFLGKKICLKEIYGILQPWLNKSNVSPDTVILGCTHYVLLRSELQQLLPPNTRLIDSGLAIAYHVNTLLNYKEIKIGFLEENIVFCTAINTKSLELSLILKKYGFPIMHEI
ncbi:glutamate racemase, partial [Pantoea sp. SoEX]|uniref:glutamate racemase n=1 Tax=Pantoea sp. SoEX TaxID=2576763 RepID=UPI001357EF63